MEKKIIILFKCIFILKISIEKYYIDIFDPVYLDQGKVRYNNGVHTVWIENCLTTRLNSDGDLIRTLLTRTSQLVGAISVFFCYL